MFEICLVLTYSLDRQQYTEILLLKMTSQDPPHDSWLRHWRSLRWFLYLYEICVSILKKRFNREN